MRRGNGTGMLVKSDLQKFFKRLRINRWRDGYTKPIEYYASGEYGDRTQRPHYHAIIFGLGFNHYDVESVKLAWHHGSVDVGMVEPASIRYVAAYIDKKILGAKAAYEGREPEFQISSQGIGLEWLRGNLSKVLYDAALSFEGKSSSVFRYYREHLRELWPDASWGMENRIILESAAHEAKLIEELIPMFQGRKYDDLDERERALLDAALYARNKAHATELEASIRHKMLMKKEMRI